MAGHSHWANIKHKKAANDKLKAAVITRMGKLIRGAIQVGGADPAMNPRLRLSITKARAAGMAKDVIERTIKKAAGEGASAAMEDLTYEGYAAGGVAMVVEAMSDNRNRTAPEVRKTFERCGGNFGAPGCVSWQFKEVSQFTVVNSDEDQVMEVLLAADCDASEINALGEGRVEIVGKSDAYDQMKGALDKAGIVIEASDVTRRPSTWCEVADLETAQKVQKLIEMLEEHEDVTAVHSNFAPTAEVAAQL